MPPPLSFQVSTDTTGEDVSGRFGGDDDEVDDDNGYDDNDDDDDFDSDV